MAGWHALIGIGEGLITVGVLSLVMATRRDLLELQRI
jgi:cobalt/nickel transport system permease protein